jgi:hypothetical protein
VTTLGELMEMYDDQLTIELVAGVLLGPEQQEQPTWGGIRIGADAAEIKQLGIELEEVELFSSSEQTDQAAEHHLEVIEEDGRVTTVNYELRLPDDERVGAFWDALEQGLATRLGSKGKGSKGKKRKWEVGDVVVELRRLRVPRAYPLEVHIVFNMYA